MLEVLTRPPIGLLMGGGGGGGGGATSFVLRCGGVSNKFWTCDLFSVKLSMYTDSNPSL